MTKRKQADFLKDVPAWPLLLDAASAAAFLSLHPSDFKRAFALGELPPPARFMGQLGWSRLALEARFAPDGRAPDPSVDPIAAAIALA